MSSKAGQYTFFNIGLKITIIYNYKPSSQTFSAHIRQWRALQIKPKPHQLAGCISYLIKAVLNKAFISYEPNLHPFLQI